MDTSAVAYNKSHNMGRLYQMKGLEVVPTLCNHDHNSSYPERVKNVQHSGAIFLGTPR